MSRGATQTRPDLRRHAAVCLSCNHWQVDVRGGAISDLGGWLETMKVIALAHSVHVRDECVNPEGRISFEGQWVEPPKMENGHRPTGTLAMQPLPRWWVAR